MKVKLPPKTPSPLLFLLFREFAHFTHNNTFASAVMIIPESAVSRSLIALFHKTL
tara:strand:- start:186 stop:350 length:165 start_codon:yes stop_codon:yes gene_type:complete